MMLVGIFHVSSKFLTDSSYRNASEEEKLSKLNNLSCESSSMKPMGNIAKMWTGEIFLSLQIIIVEYCTFSLL